MPRLVSFAISDRDDGCFDVIATMGPDRSYRREGFATLAEAEEWVDGLRALMAALGAPVTQANEAEREAEPREKAKAGVAVRKRTPEAR